jgi:stress-induced-phosphoprotein 1
MTKLNTLQKDPNQLPNMLGDPRIMEVFQVILGQQGMSMKTGDEFRKEQEEKMAEKEAPKPAPKKEPEPEPMEVEKEEEEADLSALSPEERKVKEDQKAALAAKAKGNELFKNKKFDEALAAYDEAIALDPTSMTFINNKAAVYFNTKKYDECIKACQEAV